jgi:hypothetical protein
VALDKKRKNALESRGKQANDEISEQGNRKPRAAGGVSRKGLKTVSLAWPGRKGSPW